MAKWEYRVCAVESGGAGSVEDQVNAKLRNLSDEGWRFVETFYAQHSLPLLLFKRETKTAKSLGSKSSAHPQPGG